jgi:hypothetical protein
MPAVLPSSGKEAPNLVDPWDQVILSMGTVETVTVNIGAWERIKSTGGYRKRAIEKWNPTTRLKK